MIVYPNNVEIQEFVVKAQNKIADLCTLFVKRGANLPDVLALLLELSDFIECLDDPFNTWLETDVIERIHFYNHRANLNSLVYLSMTGIEVKVVTGANSIGLLATTGDISDYVSTTSALIRATPHNSLSAIQPTVNEPGYIATERYHINKAMYDYLHNLVFPYVDPTISFVTTSVPINGNLLEMGVSVDSITLQGDFVLNSGETLQQYRYLKDGDELRRVTPDVGEAVLSYNDSSIVPLSDITYTFEATFKNGGIKQVSKLIKFRQPMIKGIFPRNQIQEAENSSLFTVSALGGAYYVGDRQDMSVTFNVPTGNANITDGTDQAMFIFIPATWGVPSRMKVGYYDYTNRWEFTAVNMTLGDGSYGTMPGLLGVYNTPTEGSTTFNMQF